MVCHKQFTYNEHKEQFTYNGDNRQDEHGLGSESF